MLAILTGLPGAGKSTVGRALAERLGWQFYDVDDTLPEEWKEINRRGEFIPQSKVDAFIQNVLFKDLERMHLFGNIVASAVLAKKEYIDELARRFPESRFIYLTAPREVLMERVRNREGHFLKAEVALRAYGSEFDLRLPENNVRTDRPLEEVVRECLSLIQEHSNK